MGMYTSTFIWNSCGQ